VQQKIRVLGICEQDRIRAFLKRRIVDQADPKQDDPLTGRIIGAAIEVHRRLGPGLLESTYETCLCYELNFIGLKVKRQIPVPIVYRETKLDSGYRIDMIIEDEVIVEIKSVASLLPVHEAQLLSYLKHNGGGRGLLINFNVKLLKNGIKRLIV
jgi:GxxExxY protein